MKSKKPTSKCYSFSFSRKC